MTTQPTLPNETELNARFNARLSVLTTRLDNCIPKIRSALQDEGQNHVDLHTLEEQAIIYAGFITDVKEKRIDWKDKTVGKILELVDEFCGVIEQDPMESVEETLAPVL
jgi:hypothetical protein